MWNLKAYADNIAVITDREEKITYRQLNEMQEEFFRDVHPNGLLFLVCTNTVTSLVIYISCILHHIPVMLEDETVSGEGMEKLLRDFKPEYLAIPIERESGIYAGILQENGYEKVIGNRQYLLAERKIKCAEPMHKDLSLLLSTSGTTGSPKHVRLTIKNLLVNTESIIQALSIRQTDRTITSMQMSYSYGLSIINTYLYQGASLILTEKKVYTPAFWKLAVKYRITSFSGVPAVYQIFQKMNVERYDLSSLKVMTQAGGGMPSELWRVMADYADRHGIHFYVMYGQTEAAARMSILPPEKIRDKEGSIGRAVSGGEFCLTDEGGQEITAPGIVGELVYKGENVSMGYAENRDELISGDERGGILQTGDYGYFDSEGFWYVTGRKDSIVKMSGKRLNLEELEEMLARKCHRKYRCQMDQEKIVILGEEQVENGEIRCLVEGTGMSRFCFEYRMEDFSVAACRNIEREKNGV